jgi:hypothetical protein
VFAQCGSLAAVASILKHGKREDLLPHGQSLLKWILASKYRGNPNTLVRKFGIKVVQRIGKICEQNNLVFMLWFLSLVCKL